MIFPLFTLFNSHTTKNKNDDSLYYYYDDDDYTPPYTSDALSSHIHTYTHRRGSNICQITALHICQICQSPATKKDIICKLTCHTMMPPLTSFTYIHLFILYYTIGNEYRRVLLNIINLYTKASRYHDLLCQNKYSVCANHASKTINSFHNLADVACVCVWKVVVRCQDENNCIMTFVRTVKIIYMQSGFLHLPLNKKVSQFITIHTHKFFHDIVEGIQQETVPRNKYCPSCES